MSGHLGWLGSKVRNVNSLENALLYVEQRSKAAKFQFYLTADFLEYRWATEITLGVFKKLQSYVLLQTRIYTKAEFQRYVNIDMYVYFRCTYTCGRQSMC